MDSRINEVMEAVMKDNGELLGKMEPLINEKLTSSIDQCFEKNTNNVDKFVSCTQEKSKKVEDIMKPFEFKLMYVSRQANECLVKGSSVKECQTQISKVARDLIENTIKAVSKI